MARVLTRLLFTGVASSLRASSCRLHSSNQCSTMAAPPPIVINCKKEHKNTVIFMHGLGDQGDGWGEMFASEMNRDHTKFICPNSASRAVTLNMGMVMPAWFDLYGLSPNDREDVEGIATASRYVHGLIDAEVAAGIPTERIIIGGFSMGGALALYAGITYPKKLGGIVGLSSFLLQRDKIPGSHTANLQTPVFLGHGSNDFLVPLTFGQLTEQRLKQFNPNVSFHVYPGMAHSSCPQELKDMQTFLNQNFK